MGDVVPLRPERQPEPVEPLWREALGEQLRAERLERADRIVELPLGVFAIAVGTATLPSFSEQVAKGHFEDLKQTVSFSLRIILFITIPATVALIALRVSIISVLFQRGEFGVQSTLLTAQALLCYAVGLWAFSVIRIIVAAFYSLQDTKSPMKAAIVALIVNALFARA